ncbi:MAG TPA: bifunctional phosphopantothenoylcysteine decarboxylase/phosphopantothenate--cysteine ligase CoaBC [Candidatus Nanoarchaeia archaeon]|nr:bifunctional phosphopantothenoylcysteine decarboxylase/phosphopantothenate--cysteine ligase CoaBC [Candidatus Nanoarchaeia archaeon]
MGNFELQGKTIVVGVSGGIACYKTIDIAKRLRNLGADVHVIMTTSSTHLADIKDFERASGNEVNTSLFHPKVNYKDYIKKNKPIKHVSLADIADLFLICPATANIIGKIANGIADDLLTTSVMATNAPVLICPAMNVKMWKNPIMQENMKKLRGLNYQFAEPEYGELACGYKGMGRLANPQNIIDSARIAIGRRSIFEGKRVIVTAGATFEEIDPVRVITNKSSGKMGARIAEEAFLMGADVILLRGSNSAEPQYHIREEKFTTVNDLFSKLKKCIRRGDIIIHCAAVSDFAMNEKHEKKIKSAKELKLELTPTAKILENLKKVEKNIFLVGFKAEFNVSKKELLQSAFSILKKADADLVVANDVGKKGAGFDADTNEVFIVDRKKKVRHFGLCSKREIAAEILKIIKEKIDG